MGAPKPPPPLPAPPPPASMLDPSLLAVRDRERARRRSKYGQRRSLMTSQYGVKKTAAMSAPALVPQAM